MQLWIRVRGKTSWRQCTSLYQIISSQLCRLSVLIIKKFSFFLLQCYNIIVSSRKAISRKPFHKLLKFLLFLIFICMHIQSKKFYECSETIYKFAHWVLQKSLYLSSKFKLTDWSIWWKHNFEIPRAFSLRKNNT